MGKDLVAWPLALATDPLGINRHHNALGAKALGGLAHELGVVHRRGIDADLVRPGIEKVADMADMTHATAHCQRDEDLAGHALHRFIGGIPALVTGGDVQKGDLVGAGLVVAPGDLDRVPGIADLDEVHPLHHAALVHVQAGNDAVCEAHEEVTESQ